MRWIFLFVLSLNLAYIGLKTIGAPATDYSDVPPLKNVEAIVLLSELKSPPSSAQRGQSKNDTAVQDAALDKSADDEVVKQPLPKQVAAVVQEKVEVPEKVVEKNAESESVVATKTSVLATPMVDDKKSDKQKVPADVAEKAKEVLPVAKVQKGGCFTMGPFRDLAKLRGLTREIKSYVVKTDFRGREEKEPTLYWVYLEPEKNRKQAIKTGKRLKAKKIKDFYVIRDGEKVNGLSLGYFRNKKSAYSLAKKVKNLHFKVVIESVVRTYTLYWLDYQLAEGVAIPESSIKKFTTSSKKEKINNLIRDCDV